MNAKQFLEITDKTLIAQLSPEDYPAFSSVLTFLNKHPEHIFHSWKIQGCDLNESLYLLLQGKNTRPKCLCGSELRFKTLSQGYSTYCSAKCREQNPITAEKRKQTNRTKFGTDNAGQAESVKAKITATVQARYGANSVLAVPTIIEQAKAKRKYAQMEVTKKIIQTNLDKYGVPCTLNHDSIKEKARTTLLERYGVEHNSQIPEVKEKKREQLFSYRKKSVFEDEVVQLLLELGYSGQIVRNSRSIINPMEIDIWLPELKLGIECNGCYWHSDPWKPKDYHKVKTDAVEAIGGKLIQLFDYEWNLKRDIVIHRLKSAIGIGKRIYARKCQVKKITLTEANSLISEVHIQGPALAKFNYGLYYDNELVAVMNFSKPRFTKKYEYELIRYASRYNVVGGASKLLNYFINTEKPNTILTYADRRWSNGNLYRKLGFDQMSVSQPGYWYFKGKDFKHRAVFQKHKLKELLPMFDESLGEVENMYANGWRRIFDSGNLVFVMNLTGSI